MATTTPNYGWDVPTSTDYVKDGASAIEILGDDIDASLFSITSGKNVGMVHLHTTNFSATSNLVINNVFTTAYQNYRIIVSNIQSIGVVGIRLAAGGTPNSTAGQYNYSGRQFDGGAGSNIFSTSANQIVTNTYGDSATQLSMITVDLQSPALATVKRMMVNSAYVVSADYRLNVLTGGVQTATAHDGFNIFASGNMSGQIRIYGMRDS
jgi:hypothetical protein